MARNKTATARSSSGSSTTALPSGPAGAGRGARRASVSNNAGRAPQRESVFEETFDAPGGRYHWREGAAMVGDAARRARLHALFTRTLVPGLERRGARGQVCAAEVPGGVREGDARWVTWRTAEAPVPVWGLYAAARSRDDEPAPQVRPANDTFVLVAWGDGPAVAWVAESEEARSYVRAALHAPPAWMSQGFASGDVGFPVRVERVGASGLGLAGGTVCTAVLPSQDEAARAARGEGAEAGSDAVRALLRAFKREHGREPFGG